MGSKNPSQDHLTVYKLQTMPFCTYSETARILGYSSRSTLYKVRRDGWLKHYEVSIDDLLKFQIISIDIDSKIEKSIYQET